MLFTDERKVLQLVHWDCTGNEFALFVGLLSS